MKQAVFDEQASFPLLGSVAGPSGANTNRISRGQQEPLNDQDNVHPQAHYSRARRTLREVLDRNQVGGGLPSGLGMSGSSRTTLHDILQQALDMVTEFESEEEFNFNVDNSIKDTSSSSFHQGQGSLK
jgi:hypothetical protein